MDALKAGRSIAFLRRRYGLTQSQLAGYLHVSAQAVSKWERGLSLPDTALLARLSVVLDTDIETILSGNLDRMQMDWHGLLVLDYASGLSPRTLLYQRTVVEVQLSYLMLAGVHQIALCGSEQACAEARTVLGDGQTAGLSLSYDVQGWEQSRATCWEHGGSKMAGLMVVSALTFLYGKDLTKTMRRAMYEQHVNQLLVDRTERSMGIAFYHRGVNDEPQALKLERGILAFHIASPEQVLAAAVQMRLLEQEMQEQVADLHEIALARGLLSSTSH